MHEQLPHYVINLARRPDRMARMTARLADLDLTAERVEACDAAAASEETLAKVIRASGPLGPLHRGDRGCTVSHFRAWEAFLASPAPAAVFLEDDVELAADYAAFARSIAWMPSDAQVVKFEKYSPRRSKKLLGPGIRTLGGRHLHRLYMRHTGAAAYLLTRAAAEALLALAGQVAVPVDHLLFSPNVSYFARTRPIYQLVPAVARQEQDEAGSDIAAQRRDAGPTKPLSARLRRGYYELNCLPWQLLLAVNAGARLRPVDYAASPGPVDP